MDANGFLQSLEQHIVACLEAMRDGLDVPPATLYRLEGQCEAAVAMGLVAHDALQARIAGHYQTVLGEVPAGARDGRIRLPLRMVTAPVYPSSKG